MLSGVLAVGVCKRGRDHTAGQEVRATWIPRELQNPFRSESMTHDLIPPAGSILKATLGTKLPKHEHLGDTLRPQ